MKTDSLEHVSENQIKIAMLHTANANAMRAIAARCHEHQGSLLAGGTHANWTREQKDAVLHHVHKAQKCLDESLTTWRKAGRHTQTWRRLKMELEA